MINNTFEIELERLISETNPAGCSPLIVGKPSPIMIKCGANQSHIITITKKVIDKAMRPEIRDRSGRMSGKTGHGLTKSMLVMALKELDSPILIFKGRQNNSLLVITSIIDASERNIVIALKLARQEGFINVTSVRSIYGRNNLSAFIGNNIDSGNLLAANKKKADELLRSIGKSYPKENTFISFK